MKCALYAVWAMLMGLLLAGAGYAQNVVSGEITGVVSDSSGAIVPNATVAINSADTGVKDATTTSASGSFRFALLHPGNYTLTVKAPGFRETQLRAVVSLGQVTSVPVQLQVGVASQVVEVTAEAPLLQTENANLTATYTSAQIDLLPSGGHDITNYALTSPGITLSTGGGYGNFTANGLPGTSNLYTVNGNDYNDPYLNLNNSGASNLLLGANELQELTVVTNGYTGEYGRSAGANVNYITKSGTNQFHGNAQWFWNGRYLNANDWFNNATGTPRPFANSNQWAGSIGGPIKKNKVFFFYDNEGLRYVLPGGGAPVFVPTAAFANATLANLTANNPQSVNFYTNIFSLYSKAPGIGRATPDTDPGLGCGDFTGAAPGGGTFGLDTPCAQTFRSTVNNLNTERLQSFTVDVNATQNDTLRFRYKQDRGVQATGTDPINAVFNANSVQPEDDGQMIWTHVINNHASNQFIAAGEYYSAIFGPPNLSASLAVFPTTIAFNDGAPFDNIGGTDSNYPQGRNVTQWQLVDDVSWTKGNHGIKFGVNFRRNDISSFASGPLTSGLITENSVTDFFNGVVSVAGGGNLQQRFANATHQPIAYYSLGLYIQDEWRVNSNLKVTLALRADRNSDEVCQHHCFARPAGSFENLDHTASNPYNEAISTGLKNALPSLEAVAWGPRVGFAWTPFGKNDWVVRGGIGIFSDLYPGFIADRFITNAPNVTTFTVTSTGADLPISPDATGNVFATAMANDAAFQASFANGTPLPAGTTKPNLATVVNHVTNPKYVEWNLQVQRTLGNSTLLSVNYVGNHGYNLFLPNAGVNTFCDPVTCGTFDTLPAVAPDSRFGVVTELRNNGISNYDGITATVTRRFAHGFQGSFNYTYSHTLDDLSNGGLLPYSLSNTANTLRVQIDPNNLRRLNYANSDYDFPHTLSVNYFWQIPFKSENHLVNTALAGWGISGNFFYKSGGPFSVYNTTAASTTLGNGTGDRVLGEYLGGPRTCSRPSSADISGNTIPCLTTSQFTERHAQRTFGNISRNAFRGPSFFDSDFSIQKDFRLTDGGLTFTMGATAFNVLNHPNFDNPIGSLSSGIFGQIYETETPPNSPYGNFQGATVSGRVLVLDLKLKF